MATLGGTVTETVTPEQVASQIEWMVRQPVDWSGHIVRCHDVAVLGGPTI
jgi:hypothetical protein